MTADRHVLRTVETMIAQLRAEPDRAEQLRATLQAYVSEHALDDTGRPRGDLLTVLYGRYPQYIDVRPVADVLGVMPSSLRVALGLDVAR